MSYEPHNFGFETTNNIAYKDFKFEQRATPIIPIVHPVQTKSIPSHFSTINKMELKAHKYHVSACDSIPYP